MVREALDESDAHTQELLNKVRSSAEPFGEKVHRKGMEVRYSPDDDYLSITLGGPQASVSLPSECGVYLLVDPDSGELNAIEVPFFAELFKEGRLTNEFWRLANDWVAAGNTHAVIPARWEQKADEAFRALVST